MSNIVSNYPRKAEAPTEKDLAALNGAFSGMFWLFLWLPFAVSGWIEIVRQLFPDIGPIRVGNLTVGVLLVLAGNLLLSKSLRNASIGLGYGAKGLLRLHLLVFLGNLVGFGWGGFIALQLKLYQEIRSSGRGFMSRRELVNSWSADPAEALSLDQEEGSQIIQVRSS